MYQAFLFKIKKIKKNSQKIKKSVIIDFKCFNLIKIGGFFMSSHTTINFKDYRKTDNQLKKLRQKLDLLIKQIPCNSRVTLDFDYKDNKFYGKLKVDLIQKSFFSTDEGILLENLTHSLCKKALKQVMKWKKSRSLEEITGIIPLNRVDSLKFHSKKVA